MGVDSGDLGDGRSGDDVMIKDDDGVLEFEFTYAQLVEVITQGLRGMELVKQGMYRGSLRYEDPTEEQELGLYVLRLTKMNALREMGIEVPGEDK